MSKYVAWLAIFPSSYLVGAGHSSSIAASGNNHLVRSVAPTFGTENMSRRYALELIAGFSGDRLCNVEVCPTSGMAKR